MRRRTNRWTGTRIVPALPALLLLAACADQGPVEPARDEAEEGFLSAEEEAAVLEGPPVSASMEADVTVTDGEVCRLVDFDDVCNGCGPQAPPGSGISFSDNWIVFEFPYAPSQPNMALFGFPNVSHIHFDPPASRVELLYTTQVPRTLEARDGSNGLLASKSVPRNTTVGSDWDPLDVDLGENVIAQVSLDAAASTSTGIDNLQVWRQTAIPVIPVEIDVKPGNDPNAVNPEGRGLLPVAVLITQTAVGESVDFDAADADRATITFGNVCGGAPVAERGSGKLMASLEDVDKDGDLDLVVHVETQALVDNGDLDDDTKELVLRGKTEDGTPIRGAGDMKVVGGGGRP